MLRTRLPGELQFAVSLAFLPASMQGHSLRPGYFVFVAVPPCGIAAIAVG